MFFNKEKNLLNIDGDLNVSGTIDPIKFVLETSQTEAEYDTKGIDSCLLWSDKYSNLITTSYNHTVNSTTGNTTYTKTIQSLTPAYGYLNTTGLPENNSGILENGKFTSLPIFITNGNYYINICNENKPYNNPSSSSGPDNPLFLYSGLYYTFKINLSVSINGGYIYLYMSNQSISTEQDVTSSLLPEYISCYQSGRNDNSGSYFTVDTSGIIGYLKLKFGSSLNKYSITWTVKVETNQNVYLYAYAENNSPTVSSAITISVSPYL